MTLLIELTGVVILLVFVLIPVKEFRQILTRLRSSRREIADADSRPPESQA